MKPSPPQPQQPGGDQHHQCPMPANFLRPAQHHLLRAHHHRHAQSEK